MIICKSCVFFLESSLIKFSSVLALWISSLVCSCSNRFCWCQVWIDRWCTGVGPGTGASILWWTGLLFFFSPFLSREWLFNLFWTGVPLCSYPSCWRQPPVPVEPCEGWVNHLQRSLRICFTSNSFFPETDIVAGKKDKGISFRKEVYSLLSPCLSLPLLKKRQQKKKY